MQFKQQNYSPSKKLFYAWFEAMFTRIDIAIAANRDRNDLEEICLKIDELIQKYEQIANRFDPESELSFINNNAFGQQIAISDELYELLQDCQSHWAETDGYFDISVYSKPRKSTAEPAFYLESSTKTIQFSDEGIFLDLSGFLKGFVLRKIINLIDEERIEDILVNIGNSSLYAKGHQPFGQGWKIILPEPPTEYALNNECLTTSGNTIKTKWNIINPITSETAPVKKSVTVITEFPDDGEVLSKVAYLASGDALEKIMKKYNARVV